MAERTGIRVTARPHIVAAARTAFSERGLFGTSTRDIAVRSGVSQAYVVRSFGTKIALFETVVSDALDRPSGEGAAARDEQERVIYYARLMRNSDGLSVTLRERLSAHPGGVHRPWLTGSGSDGQSAPIGEPLLDYPDLESGL